MDPADFPEPGTVVRHHPVTPASPTATSKQAANTGVGMTCPYLAYCTADGSCDSNENTEFETPRAFCTVAETFVQPVRADICNERYGLHPEDDCEYFREHEGLGWTE